MGDVVNISSIQELQKASAGTVVELPSFDGVTKFYAKLRRPSMMALVKTKQIPNSLLTSANSIFENGLSGGFNPADAQILDKYFDILEVICEASFVQPTYKEIKDAGIELTDEQYMFIFDFAQNGVRQLEPFREER